METFISAKSKVYIVTNDGGIRKPDISEVEFADSYKGGNKVRFEGAITDEKITKCRCNDDEIILEKTQDNILKINTAYKADHALYKTVVGLAISGDYGLEINKCENLRDMFHLDKIVENFSEKGLDSD